MSDDTIHGEDSLIQEFLAPLAAGFPGAFGLRDDCAVISLEAVCELVVKTDPIIAGVHFLADAEPEDIAWRALAVNVSDLAAKGAKPVAYLMALALPEVPQRTWMQRFAAGLEQAQAVFGCHLIGGDTDRTPGPLTVSITAFGSVPSGKMVLRTTAQVGDQLFVTGTLGDAALGLELLKRRGLRQTLGLAEHDAAGLVGRFLRPEPRLAVASLLRAHASAAMDLSDGLAKDCGRMCAASGVGARIFVRDLPLSEAMCRAVEKDTDWLERVLAGGDDYEILAAVPTARAPAFTAAARSLDFRMSHIGKVTTGAGVSIERPDGTQMVLERTGWDHFD